MAKPLNLPKDLIADWARRHAAANAKLEGRELPDNFIASVQAQQFLAKRKQGTIASFPDTDYDMYIEPPQQLKMEPLWR